MIYATNRDEESREKDKTCSRSGCIVVARDRKRKGKATQTRQRRNTRALSPALVGGVGGNTYIIWKKEGRTYQKGKEKEIEKL